MTRRALLMLATAVVVASSGYAADTTIPPYIQAAVSNPKRRASDLKYDAARRPAELLAFSGVKPGDHVADILPGSGYLARLLSAVTGPRGHVYAILPQEYTELSSDVDLQTFTRSRLPRSVYPNISVPVQPLKEIGPPEPLDVVLLSGDYHGFFLPELGHPDIAAFNRAIFKTLKPGGVYIVSDYSAVSGSGFVDTQREITKRTMRIDPEVVKSQVRAAGFVLESESALLANPADPHTGSAYSPSLFPNTDQFLFRFRKPR